MARAGIVALAVAALALSAAAETAWVKDELSLNLRTGPGTQYRIKGSVKTGDQLEVLRRGNGWTQVRAAEIGDGWIPGGFLLPDPPAGVRLAQVEAQTAEFRAQFESVSNRAQQLANENATLSQNDAAQKQQIEQLSRENFELQAGARWPEWITGAGILGIGMAMGAIVHSVSGRRQRPRIRL